MSHCEILDNARAKVYAKTEGEVSVKCSAVVMSRRFCVFDAKAKLLSLGFWENEWNYKSAVKIYL